MTHFLYSNEIPVADAVILNSSGVSRNFVWGGVGSTNSVEDRGQGERGSGGGSP